ncbi:MAG: cyclophilin-like fold protein [Candidatus Verstraetearchaeota archaeon]|nr:cyclophilin-like fold protein [Candidatus Verstraetearchaeota archaeon]
MPPLKDEVPISIVFESTEVTGTLSRILSPRTVEGILGALPITSRTFLWKEEVYFEIPITIGPEKPRSSVTAGALAYWPPSRAFCIFFGSSQPYSPVNLVGRLVTTPDEVRKVKQGEWVTVKLK